MATGGSSLLKYIFFISNFLFVLTGIALIATGIHVRSPQIPEWQGCDKVTSEAYTLVPYLLVFIGAVVCVVVFYGYQGAVQENHHMIVTFSMLVMVILVADVVAGVIGVLLDSDATDFASKALNETIADYNENSQNVYTDFWDNIQDQFSCCGAQSYDDWAAVNKPLPLSCCDLVVNGTDVVPCSPVLPTLHKTGCLYVLTEKIQDNMSNVGFVASVVAVVHLAGVIVSRSFANFIENDFQSV